MQRLDQLKRLFPEAFPQGHLDWERLHAALAAEAPDAAHEPPVYRLHWRGRHDAERTATTPTDQQAVLVPDDSLASHTPLHTFWEGDNLDVLKLLQPEYRERVSLIYIDPPYNTGQRFSYRDNFRDNFRARSSRRSSPSKPNDPATSFAQAGQSHAPWLSMMHPRLALARELLTEQGAIFVSIDDNEVHNLRVLMDEIFGSSNFVANVVWRKKVVRGRGAAHVLPQTEYILVYAKQLVSLPAFSEPLTARMRKEYRHEDEQGPYKLIPLAKSGTSHSPRPNLVYPIEAPDGTRIECPTHQWRWSQETLERKREQVVFRKGRDGTWRVFTKQHLVVDGKARRRTPPSYYDNYTTTHGTQDLKALFGEVVMDFPKPVGLIEDLLVWLTGETPHAEHIVLDFFAGSGTTGEAVLRLNQHDGGNRRCLLVQIPDPTPPRSAARRAGFATIADLCKERLRRVLHQLHQHAADANTAPPPGFRVMRLEPRS